MLDPEEGPEGPAPPYKTNPYIQGGVYSSFKAMEMIQGILGFEIFSSGILEGRGREILENMF